MAATRSMTDKTHIKKGRRRIQPGDCQSNTCRSAMSPGKELGHFSPDTRNPPSVDSAPAHVAE
jgi:hypothetical protein